MVSWKKNCCLFDFYILLQLSQKLSGLWENIERSFLFEMQNYIWWDQQHVFKYLNFSVSQKEYNVKLKVKVFVNVLYDRRVEANHL